MLKLRLKRFGRKKIPCYRIVLINNTSRRDSSPIKEVGFYDPINNKVKLNIIKIVIYFFLILTNFINCFITNATTQVFDKNTSAHLIPFVIVKQFCTFSDGLAGRITSYTTSAK